ncbi:hypothetical protein RJ55_01021 [Drechmeria coniospora]|nr:hypothetical protein RJ55_01021 [Drechmeria coniospora]
MAARRARLAALPARRGQLDNVTATLRLVHRHPCRPLSSVVRLTWLASTVARHGGVASLVGRASAPPSTRCPPCRTRSRPPTPARSPPPSHSHREAGNAHRACACRALPPADQGSARRSGRSPIGNAANLFGGDEQTHR